MSVANELDRKKGLALLKELNINFVTKNEGAHCYFIQEGKRYDFWPGAMRLKIAGNTFLGWEKIEKKLRELRGDGRRGEKGRDFKYTLSLSLQADSLDSLYALIGCAQKEILSQDLEEVSFPIFEKIENGQLYCSFLEK